MGFLSLRKQKIFQTKSNLFTNLSLLLYCMADCLLIKVSTGYPKSCVISLNVDKINSVQQLANQCVGAICELNVVNNRFVYLLTHCLQVVGCKTKRLKLFLLDHPF